jgi:hypothetical protein
MIISGSYTGEFKQFTLDISPFEVLILLVITVVGFLMTFFFYRYTKNIKFYFTHSKWCVNLKRLNFFYFLLLVANIIFFIKTGVGLASGGKSSPISFIFAPLNVGVIFPIFYILCRKSRENKYFFWVNAFLFSTLSLIKGWTGFLLLIAIFEIYFFLKTTRNKSSIKLLMILLVPIIIFLAGGKVYQYLYTYKFEVRGMGTIELSYTDAVIHLVDRLTFFPIAVGVYEKNTEIKRLYFQDGVEYKEIQGLFRPLVPRVLMPNKEFRSLNNNSKQAFMPFLSDKTSNDIGFVMYGISLFSINFIEGLAWLIFSVMLIFFVKILLDSLEQFKGQFNLLYFLQLIKFYNTASLEVVFGNGYLYLVYIFPVFFALGIIKLKRTH